MEPQQLSITMKHVVHIGGLRVPPFINYTLSVNNDSVSITAGRLGTIINSGDHALSAIKTTPDRQHWKLDFGTELFTFVVSQSDGEALFTQLQSANYQGYLQEVDHIRDTFKLIAPIGLFIILILVVVALFLLRTTHQH